AVHAAGEPFAAEWPQILNRSPIVHLNLSPAFLPSIEERLRGTRVDLCSVVLPSDALLSRCAGWARRELDGHGIGSRLAWDTLALAIALQLLRAAPSTELNIEVSGHGLPPKALARVLERLHDDMGARVSLETLSQDSGMSRFHFCRQFRRSTGLSPHQYQLRIRVERAQELMSRSPERSLAQIALECGFYDQAHLTRVFRRYVGETPGRFRAQLSSTPRRPVL
ncbi:MAG: AraC family transcriptional regulator, partial [Myxococcota bacterium]